MSMRGKLAFQWNKSLTYEQSKEQVTMLGGVQVAPPGCRLGSED